MNDSQQTSDLPEFDGELIFRIDKKDLKPMNDPKCVHEYVDDPSDVTETFYAQVCKHCPVGRLVRK